MVLKVLAIFLYIFILFFVYRYVYVFTINKLIDYMDKTVDGKTPYVDFILILSSLVFYTGIFLLVLFVISYYALSNIFTLIS